MNFVIKNAHIHREDGSFTKGELYIKGDRISLPFDTDTVVDAGGAFVCPGLFDIHTHGRCGGDFCTATPEKLREMAADFAANGVTAILPTLASDTLENWQAALRRMKASGIRAFVGAHLEGRWLSHAKRGAHAAELLAPASAAELRTLAADADALPIFKVSFAPELDETGDFIDTCRAIGAVASIAHTDADYATTVAALSAGATSFTHLFNAMPPLHHRSGGPVAAALSSDAYTELICDGLHVAPETVKILKKAKGIERLILISDSMEGTGCPDGAYAIAGQAAFLRDGIARTASGNLAGSTLNLLRGVQNLAAYWDIPFGEALLSATLTPARSLSLEKDFGTLRVGAYANLFFLDDMQADRPSRVLSFGEWVE